MSDDDRKTEPPLHLDMPFDEALRRFVQTKPEEVEPAPGKERKVTKGAKRMAAFASSQAPPQNDKGKTDKRAR